ncbi:hypothetical protein [Kangiella shandongensis]|uniref:hypothetical protein n=1 Tax=Kangiella shandongensis TaxID=2763258 RepID=UPI001CBA9F28|nr:hypothetical protein [Kangiella shandongensis]
MASLFLAYGLVLAAFAAALFWLILKVYRNESSESYSEDFAEGLFAGEGNVVDLSAFRRADVSALRLIQEYSIVEASNLTERDKLQEILAWNQKLENFERNNRSIIQSRGFLKPVQSKEPGTKQLPVTEI